MIVESGMGRVDVLFKPKSGLSNNKLKYMHRGIIWQAIATSERVDGTIGVIIRSDGKAR
jgi:hypothetical protein